MQVYTQYGGIRPFGVSLLIAGVDDFPRLFEAEPSGAMTAYKADSIGADKKEVDEILEKHYKETLTIEEAIKIAVGALKKTREETLIPDNMEIGYASITDKKFVTLNEKQIAQYLK